MNIENLISIAEFLNFSLGDDYEIIVLSKKNKKIEVLKIFNPIISGNKDNINMNSVVIDAFLENNKMINKKIQTITGKMYRTSMLPLESDKNEGIALVINYDYSKLLELQNALSKLLDTKEIIKEEITDEIKSRTPEETIRNMCKSILSKNSGGQSNSDDIYDVIYALKVGGAFLIKGSVAIVAEELELSEATIYRYLARVNSQFGSRLDFET